LHYGQRTQGLLAPVQSPCDLALARLLDTTVIGTTRASIDLASNRIDADISAYTQQITEHATILSPTQGAFKQTEVGRRPSIVVIVLEFYLAPPTRLTKAGA
jgi:hypothetical protein